MKFHQDDLTQKSYGFRYFRYKGRLSSPAWDHHKKVWTATSLRQNSTSRATLESYPSRTLKYAVLAGLPKRLKNYSSFNFLAENSEKFRSTELYGAALEGSTIFLCRSSLGSTSMECCQLADLKYAIFSSSGCKTKKLPRSKLFLSMVFKHGLLEGSTSEQMWSTVFPRGWDAR